MGLCRLRLGQLMKARQAFERVLQVRQYMSLTSALGMVQRNSATGALEGSLFDFSFKLGRMQLDPENVEALVALGIMDISSNDCKSWPVPHSLHSETYYEFVVAWCALSLNRGLHFIWS